MTLAIHSLEHRPAVAAADVDAFLAAHTFPLVEGRKVTFVFRGEADGVYLQHWIHALPQGEAFQRVPGTDLWFLVMDLPERSRIEYKLGVEHRGQQRLIQDPLNDNYAQDPYGANSVVHGAGYEPPDWVTHDPKVRPGEVEDRRLASRVFHQHREVSIYKPARFRASRRYPLLVVHDGRDYMRFANLKEVLDNLIHRLEIPPLIAVMTQSPNRLHEYADDERHAAFLVEELVPMMEEAYPLIGTPATRSLMGSSFGAVATLSTAWRHQGFFGNLLLQSGSFAFTDIGDHDRGPVFDPVVEFVNKFREEPGRPSERVYLTCGTYESLIYYNRSLVPLFQDTGMQVRYAEVRDGHNWENWRDRLREALSWLMPGPLWMVYE